MKTQALLLAILSLWVASAFAQDRPAIDKPTPRPVSASLNKTTGEPFRQVLNINNWLSWFAANGNGNNPPSQQGDGGFYPRGTRWVIYEDGIVWGGKCYLDAAHTQPADTQLIRVGGGTYNVGTQAGAILGTGAAAVAESQSDPSVRIYRIRRDFVNQGLYAFQEDAAEFFQIPASQVTYEQMQTVRDQYEKDWNEWPVSKGSPYIERNGVPGYQPPSADISPEMLVAEHYDEPGIAMGDPDHPADQVLWTVCNDLNPVLTQGFLGCDPMGLEVQYTLWAYKRTDEFGQVYFKRARIINKGGVNLGGGNRGAFFIDDMYLAQWSDPDIGSLTDDLAGCDTTLQMGYMYNGLNIDREFQKLSMAPPAVGYMLLQGPVVPGNTFDQARFDGRLLPGKKNLPMTSFGYFATGSAIAEPPASYEGALRWWKLLRGYVPDPSSAPDRLYPFPPGFTPNKFPLSGDPVTGTGFVDGGGSMYSFSFGDRRICVCSGPFSMAPGDTQEVILATVGGISVDRLRSITAMRFSADRVRRAFLSNLAPPQPPAAPITRSVTLDDRVLLEWGFDTLRVSQTELTVLPGSLTFEGYNVYQLPSGTSSLSEGKKIATFDALSTATTIVQEVLDPSTGLIDEEIVQEGNNTGIRRNMELTRNYLAGPGKDDRLKTGAEYFFAVTAYNYSADPRVVVNSLESSPSVVVVRPGRPFGVELRSQYGDTLRVTHPQGHGDGVVVPTVVNPRVGSGATYEVRFDSTSPVYRWSLRNLSTGKTVLSDQMVSGATWEANAVFHSPTIDGVEISVLDADYGFRSLQVVSTGAGPLASPDMGAFAFDNTGFPTINRLAPDSVNDRPQVPNLLATPGTASLTNGGKWGIHTGMNSATMAASYSYFLTRVTQSYARWPVILPYDYEIRFTAAGGIGWNAFTDEKKVTVPFELWNIGIGTPDDPSDDYRMFPYLVDVDGNDQFNLLSQVGVDTVNGGAGDNGTGLYPGVADHSVSDGNDDPFTDWFYWVQPANKTPGQAGYNAIASEVNAGTHYYLGPSTAGTDVLRRMVLVNWNGGSVSDPTWPANVNQLMPATGTVFRILTTKPLTASDVFRFTISAPDTGVAVQKLSAERVGVFPNPFYGVRTEAQYAGRTVVTFLNLPPKVKIRIFNLAGQLVKTLEKDNTSQFLDWDLTNENNWLVASGMYLCYVEMPGIGVSKVLKLAVISPAEF